MSPERSFQRTRATWTAYAAVAFFAYLETVLGPAMPFVRSHLHLSYTVASLHFAAFAAGSMTVGFFVHRIYRRLGKKVALWGGISGMTAGVLLIALSPSALGTIAGALLMGVFGTLSLVANQAILADMHAAHRTVALTESNVIASTAAILAPLALGAFDAIGLGWQAALIVAIPVLALMAGAFSRVEFPSSLPVEYPAAKPGGLPRIFWMFWIVLFLAASIEWSIGYWGADYLSSVVGMRERSAATAMSLYFVAFVAGRFTSSRLVRRIPAVLLLMWSMAIALAAFPIFWLGGSPVVCLIGLFFTGIGVANFYPLSIGAATDLAGSRSDEATARLSVSGASALLTMPFIIGTLSDAVGMKRGFVLILALLISALALMSFTARAIRRSSGPHEADAVVHAV